MAEVATYSKDNIPQRSMKYKDKEIAAEGYVNIRGKQFYKRTYTDGCAELARLDENTGMHIYLCFPKEQPPLQISTIKEAIKHNFDPALLRG